MTFLIAIAAFLPLLAVLVVVHELGHFFTARAFGVKVLEFGLGYPPRLFGIRTGRTRVRIAPSTNFVGARGMEDTPVGTFVRMGLVEGDDGALVARIIEVGDGRATFHDDDLRIEGPIRSIDGDALVVADMVYSVNLLPLGGFVRLAGENNHHVPRSLASKGTGPRFVILFAGAFMNGVLAIALLTGVFMTPRDVTVGDLLVAAVEPGSPAEAAGVRPGDIVVRAGNRDVENGGDLSRAITFNLGKEMEWVLQRGTATEVAFLRPRVDPPEGQGAAGIRMQLVNASVESRSDSPWTAFTRSFTTIGDMLVLAKNEFARWIGGGSAPDLAGPVGIAQATGEVARDGGILILIGFAAFLSMNLAILNVLPIPMLDGGRLVFVVLEWLRRGKRISPEKEGLVHLIGFGLLVSVVVVISYFDILRIIQGDSLIR